MGDILLVSHIQIARVHIARFGRTRKARQYPGVIADHFRATFSALLIGMTAGCTISTEGEALIAPISTNDADMPSISDIRCDFLPEDTLVSHGIRPHLSGEYSHTTTSGLEKKICYHRAIDRRFTVGFVASNERFARAEISVSNARGTTVHGRHALAFPIVDDARAEVEICEVDIAASTGRFGVRMETPASSHGASFAPYEYCLESAKFLADAFAPYFPL
ncbi:DUF3558 domain-containing protein [Mycobacteroides immunogenum]|uniref:DUF3558 domain-containing protein n=1 Tax=Mycobacteroides immunogenum TaxID=83262 RepID=UPI000AF2E9B6|nr:DUF3558 domain-containing protein [Mycobacteroides immunogenum]